MTRSIKLNYTQHIDTQHDNNTKALSITMRNKANDTQHNGTLNNVIEHNNNNKTLKALSTMTLHNDTQNNVIVK